MLDASGDTSELLRIKRQRLQVLEQQAAKYGFDCPAHVTMEIDDLRKEIARIRQETATFLQPQPEEDEEQSLLLSSLLGGTVPKPSEPPPDPLPESEPSPSAPPEKKSSRQPSRDIPKKLRRRLRIFLCHSSGDKDAVRLLYHQLRSDGFNPWLDTENLLPGDEWKLAIPQAVRSSHIVIVCLSPGSITKEGYVQREIRTALDVADEKPEGANYIIPLKLQDCPLPSRLSRWQAVNLYDERGYADLVARLLKSVRERFEAGTLDEEPPARPVVKLSDFTYTPGVQTPSPNRYQQAARPPVSSARSRNLTQVKNGSTRGKSRRSPTVYGRPGRSTSDISLLPRGWLKTAQKNLPLMITLILSVLVLLYRSSGMKLFVSDLVLLPFLAGLAVLPYLSKVRGRIREMFTAFSALFVFVLILVYVLFFGSRGVDFVTIDQYSTHSFDNIDTIFSLIAIGSFLWLVAKITSQR